MGEKDNHRPDTYAVSQIMGLLWAINNEPDNRNGLLDSLAEAYIGITILGPYYRLPAKEMEDYISKQLGGDGSALPKSEFVKRCYEVCVQAGDGTPMVISQHCYT